MTLKPDVRLFTEEAPLHNVEFASFLDRLNSLESNVLELEARVEELEARAYRDP